MTDSSTTLRLVWPQWQGAAEASVRPLADEFPYEVARRGYSVGSAILEAVLPAHAGPTAKAPVSLGDEGLEMRDGVDAKTAVVGQLGQALDVIAEHDPARVLTLGGECSVSVAPFAHLAAKYGDDVALVWIDSHPDVGTPDSEYPGYHAMAVTSLLGKGDSEVTGQLPGTFASSRVALAGLHVWEEDDIPHVSQWGLASFSPEDLRTSSEGLLSWLKATGCSKVAIHLDVDTVDANEVILGLGKEPDGLTVAQVQRVVADLEGAAEVVGLTIAEFFPRQVMHLLGLLDGFPMIGATR
ncbi:arginase family protein [Demequina salsinemoris]|uniref:arginase family protein n=1 Tax=Demequina salsinemoris TaxID=577470 RepID=UPI0007835C26|nr:arginase family protein [Demequina salsinemoris]